MAQRVIKNTEKDKNTCQIYRKVIYYLYDISFDDILKTDISKNE